MGVLLDFFLKNNGVLFTHSTFGIASIAYRTVYEGHLAPEVLTAEEKSHAMFLIDVECSNLVLNGLKFIPGVPFSLVRHGSLLL